MDFQIHALPLEPFAGLFDLSEEELAAQNMHRVTTQKFPGSPCRITLEDAPVGEDVILLNHKHLEGSTPYAASHAIYVRDTENQAHPAIGEIPEVLTRRTLSLRGFDDAQMIIAAEIVEGADLALTLAKMFDDPAVRFVHIHFAGRGCYAAKATRA